PQAKEALRACLALGADRCIHLSDRVFAVADTLGTSRTLAMAIEKEGEVDLVVCGRKTTASETWQVPPEVAAFLDRQHLTSVVETELTGNTIRARRVTDDGFEKWETSLPAVVSLANAHEATGEADGQIDVWTARDLVDDLREYDKRFGQPGSPTRVLAVRDVTPERAGKLGGENVALVLGADTGGAVDEAARYGADRIVVVDDERLAAYHPQLWSAAVRSIVRQRRPHVLIVPATANGRDLAPRVAGELHLGMTGDCVGLGIDRAGRLIQTKPAYGGNIVSVIMGATTPQLATVRARMFEPLDP